MNLSIILTALDREPYNIAADCVDKHAKSAKRKNKEALIFVKGQETSSLSYSDLERLTNKCANALFDIGVKGGDRMILRLPNGPAFPIAFLGAIKAGVIPIPTSPLWTEHELDFVIKDSGAVALITSEKLLPRTLSLKTVVSTTTQNRLPPGAYHFETLLKEALHRFEVKPTDVDAPAYWLYTSGTEGAPKAVIHAHRSIPAHDMRVKVWQNLKNGDIAFHTSALNWSYALTCGFLDLLRHGATAVIYEGPPEAEHLLQIIEEQKVTLFMSVPGIYRRLVRYLSRSKRSFGNVRVALSAGEKLPEETRHSFRKLTGLEIYEGLGMTEQSVYLAQPFGKKPIPGSCGKALPNHRIAILKEDLSEAAPNAHGILATHRSSPGLMLGYHNRPEEEEKVFRGDWFLSNDLAKKDADGNFFFLGRCDDILTAGGYRISPLEVEAVLNRSPYVVESAVISKEVGGEKTIVCAYVVPTSNEVKEKEVLDFASEWLAPYKVPREIIFVKSLPKTHSGKLKRSCLKGSSTPPHPLSS